MSCAALSAQKAAEGLPSGEVAAVGLRGGFELGVAVAPGKESELGGGVLGEAVGSGDVGGREVLLVALGADAPWCACWMK